MITVSASKTLEGTKIGDSIALNGVCLTVTEILTGSFRAEASGHTLLESTLGSLLIGSKVNLERALMLGDRLGGHLVQGHVDALGKVSKVRFRQGYNDVFIEYPGNIENLLPPRGSLTIDGVSLTIADKNARTVRLMIVPHTLDNTTLGELKPGDKVNIETDIIIRWLADRYEPQNQNRPFTWEINGENVHLED